MIFQIDQQGIFTLFEVDNFNTLRSAIDSFAPSNVEYNLFFLIENGTKIFSLDRRYVVDSIYCGKYAIFMNYADEIFIESSSQEDDEQERLF